MSFVISSALPFPNIAWWCYVLDTDAVKWDLSEYFVKMSYRNRYYIAGGNGVLKLSIPMKKGRDQRGAVMKDIGISYNEQWQRQHWRTLFSAYNRSPYFEHFAPELEQLLSVHYETLPEFNIASVHWVRKQLGLRWEEGVLHNYQKEYPDAAYDLRNVTPGKEPGDARGFPTYYQVFGERNGLAPNLSILDLLFAEGPHTLSWLKENGNAVKEWGRGVI